MKNEFPYKKFEFTARWDVINRTIEDLVENKDIQETTDRKYIVGYLCKALFDAGVINIESEK